MRGEAFAIVLASALAAGCSMPGPQVRVRDTGPQATGFAANLALAKQKFGDGELAVAASAFRAALRENPDSVAALNGLAATYDRLGRYDLSGPLYVQAMVLAPDSKMVRTNYALSLRLRGKSDLADTLEKGGFVADLEPPRPTPIEPGTAALATAEPLAAIAPPAAGPRLVLHEGTVELVTRFRPVTSALALSGAPDAPPATASAAPRPVVAQLTIVNGSGRTAAAARMRSRLLQRGWANTRLANAPRPVVRSTVEYAPWARRHAANLVAQLPFPVRLVPRRNLAGLRLVIGTSAQGMVRMARSPAGAGRS